MKTYCVYHFIHIHTPYRYLPKLVITNVPDDVMVTEDLVDRAGYDFSEFGIPWANHYLTVVDPVDSPADLVRRIKRKEYDEILNYDELIERAYHSVV
ncbi:MAG: hypothetical protein K6T65_08800 [Peptococcaceae bacterium]|nr:hypothetical protein [Peptococcaceae bacterium]